MKRLVYDKLLAWKNKSDDKRKPLLLEGARQVGKSWLLEELGRNEFDSVALINFEEDKQLATLFDADFDTERILRSIEIASGVKLIPGKTLIIFDEIQSVSRGLLSLKYLYNNAPQYHIAAAGSLLGISLHKEDSFPVGKVEFIDVYPLSFEEFMMALGKDAMVDSMRNMDWELIKVFREQYIDLLKQYYFVGGMPEVVASYVKEKDFSEVRSIQNDLLRSYDADFSKHPPMEIIPRIKMVWNSIPSQLAKENKKFIFNAVKPGGRAKDFELAIEWLKQAGLLYKITRINNGTLPLDGFEDPDAYKLFTLDIGLLGAQSGLDAKTLIDGNAIFTQYKGALTEQYVLQQLLCNENIKIHYWTPTTGVAEVDFVVQLNDKVIPIEVKAEENLKAKSLKSFNDKYKPELSIRTSMSDFRAEKNLTNLPLYAISELAKL
ncbi:MAG: ATP-binding protein [Tidjanibacter sp.]|nr:ATP-binding protein [Tidjanibacter sp.]